MRNYYDDLEVSKTASKEVIGKVYKILAKKYHPDTTKEADKVAAEEKFKIISEAYEVLSDDEKRKIYDFELEKSNPTISLEDYMNVVNQRDYLNNSLKGLQIEFNNFRNSYVSNMNKNNNININQQQAQYNPQNQTLNNNYNNFQNQTVNQNSNNINSNSQGKKYYYNTVTGKRVSAFDYYKYKIKNFISNILFYILLLILLVFVINSIISNGLYNFFK